ncbi:MAG: hypothetical protein RR945_02055 [Erysipelotrichaceae bacterium]
MNSYETIFNSASSEEKSKMIDEILQMDKIPNVNKDTLVDMIRFTRNQCVQLSNQSVLNNQLEEGWD